MYPRPTVGGHKDGAELAQDKNSLEQKRDLDKLPEVRQDDVPKHRKTARAVDPGRFGGRVGE